jgi:hypothetical protein
MTDQRPRTALIAGATGLVGAELLDQLLADPAVARAHSLVRRPSGRPIRPWSSGSSTPATRRRLPWRRRSLAYCCPTAPPAAALPSPGGLRARGGVRAPRFGPAPQLTVVSSLGADPESRSFYLRTKGEVERELIALGLPSPASSGVAAARAAPGAADRRAGR